MDNRFKAIIDKAISNNYQLYGLNVYENNDRLFAYSFDSEEKRYPAYSATKSVAGLGIGIAVDEGLLDLAAPITEYIGDIIPVWIPGKNVDALRRLSLERFLTMSIIGYHFRPESSNWFEEAINVEIKDPDRVKFAYTNFPAYLAGVAAERAVGGDFLAYLTERVFDPLHISNANCRRCPSGYFYGASGMELSCEELSRIGRVYAYGGVFDNNRIVSKNYVDLATTSHIYNSSGGYGYFVWINKTGGFQIRGKWGQRSIVGKDSNRVLTYMSHMPDNYKTLEDEIDAAFL